MPPRSSSAFCFFGEDTLTFGALEQSVGRLAAGLAGAGVGQGRHVAVMLPNHPDHIVTILALARIGAVLVPVNVHLKQAGLRYQLDNARVDSIIADVRYAPEVLAATVSAPARQLVWRGGRPDGRAADVRFETLAESSGVLPVQAGEPDRLAAIMYTSGTTGPPKGVMLSSRMLDAAAHNAARVADIQPDDVLFLWEPLYHIAGVQAIALCLRHGVPCALVERFSASAFWDQVRRYGATKVHYLGGVFSILMKQPPRLDDADNPARIAWGAAAPGGLWREFERRFGVEVRECYGLTEGSSFTTMNLEGKVGSVGKPVDHFEVAIVDDNDQPLGAGQVGEIVQRGRQPGLVMRGYHDDPAGTAAAFRNGWLHTGDLGYRDQEGFYYYAGRKKDSIRTRGENVSAWEIEQVVVAYPGVAQCAAIAVPSDTGESDIKVFIRPADNRTIDPLDVIRWCDERLAHFQVPRYVAFVTAFPLTPSQRIRKEELSREVSGCWDAATSGYRARRKA